MAASQQNDGGDPAAPRPLQMGAKGAYIVRLLMVGDSSCGKTSLVLRFDQNVFSTKFVTTIGVDYRDKMVKVRYVFVVRELGGGLFCLWLRAVTQRSFYNKTSLLLSMPIFHFFNSDRGGSNETATVGHGRSRKISQSHVQLLWKSRWICSVL